MQVLVLHERKDFTEMEEEFSFQTTPFRYFRRIRSSHRRCSVKKAVPKHFANFAEKHLCWSPFLVKVQVVRPATLLKRPQHRCFPVKFCEIFKNLYFEEYLQATASEESTISGLILRLSLTHFAPMLHFYTSWRHQKIVGFFIFRRYRNVIQTIRLSKLATTN